MHFRLKEEKILIELENKRDFFMEMENKRSKNTSALSYKQVSVLQGCCHLTQPLPQRFNKMFLMLFVLLHVSDVCTQEKAFQYQPEFHPKRTRQFASLLRLFYLRSVLYICIEESLQDECVAVYRLFLLIMIMQSYFINIPGVGGLCDC